MTGTASEGPEDRAGGRRLVSGVLWNALGRAVPLMVALVLTPMLVHLLGTERWGLFTLALAMVGIFGVFDLGLGMALTRAVSERIGEGRLSDTPSLIGATIYGLLGLSAVMAAIAWTLMPLLVGRVLLVPESLQAEAISAFRVLALAAPLVVLNAALWGVLAAWQRFRVANLVNMPVSIFYALGPVIALLIWDSLAAAIVSVVLVRLASGLAYAALAWKDVPGLGLNRPRFGLLRPLLRQGGWMSLSGALTQVLLYADRFLIGSLIGLTAVAFYATPLDLVMRMWILPVAVAQTLLPAIASAYRTAPEQTALLLRRGALMVAGLALPACLGIVALAWTLLWLWLGTTFADGSGMVLRILGAGIFFSCVAFVPGTFLDAIGRPNVTATFSLAQAAVFLPLGAGLLLLMGIEGAAIAWALRAATDCFGRFMLVAHFYPAGTDTGRALRPPLAAAALGFALMIPMPGFVASAVVGAVTLAVAGWLGWRVAPTEDKARLMRLIRRGTA
ncbi:flippase [Neoroseomonas oryzicola]|uniref:Flippase n=1 Tax=Neoroseomonas oryzicola TaxID=535904 RepID=A0A9X9WBV9_9PROT|nr:flippase [Neoroseomonas oryzicola]MBR0657819.1 flippase [Neoroseomonas oryzicola]NKE18613.1 flippase [Neoroseomonas oryzicola]